MEFTIYSDYTQDVHIHFDIMILTVNDIFLI